MGTYVVTGAASGMGAAVAAQLRADGHVVIGVDRDETDVVADLSTPAGRAAAAIEVLQRCDGVLAGAVLAAGVGPAPGREQMILEVNYLGVTELLDRLRPALARGHKAKVVVFGSNSTTATPFMSKSVIRRLVATGDTERAARRIRRRGAMLSGPLAYATSKTAVAHWARMRAVSNEWAAAGIRVNIIAPGPVMTPLLRAQLDGAEARNVKSFPVPVREYGTPEQLAAWVAVMLSDAADFMTGAVITVDGGTEALLRTREWPTPLPLRGVPKMLWRMYRAPKEGQVAQY
ncbi:SDR family oxidoreductase [Gordonia sp. ABSL1-1]|uniref:SDR family oxidoreductase n=1 Tax=Gordonia sp. ABSL1-1 TaxID=3053923 RepID=UPI002573AC37|nr:SDR family oxidoreductase [Gordonia sp. ABSL1-1]MDL9938635.1 SDR family oxidoreductase [Gordonia sp. ABSL1-1]